MARRELSLETDHSGEHFPFDDIPDIKVAADYNALPKDMKDAIDSVGDEWPFSERDAAGDFMAIGLD